MISPSNKKNIEKIHYQPAHQYPYDLEVFRVKNLKNRTKAEVMAKTFNYDFFMLILITEGKCVQQVDFESVLCESGDLLILQPGQVHNFGADQDWDGWMILFRSEFILSNLVDNNNLELAVNPKLLPQKVPLQNKQLQRVNNLIIQMKEDTGIDVLPDDINILLRYQTLLLLKLLSIHSYRYLNYEDAQSKYRKRFTQFQTLIEEHYTQWHKVADYSKALKCSEKSLTRSTLLSENLTAKAFIAARINLEAKRLLAHTDLSITMIAEKLGFEETTHFTKFFKRETGCLPTEFKKIK